MTGFSEAAVRMLPRLYILFAGFVLCGLQGCAKPTVRRAPEAYALNAARDPKFDALYGNYLDRFDVLLSRGETAQSHADAQWFAERLYDDLGHPVINSRWQDNVIDEIVHMGRRGEFSEPARAVLREAMLEFAATGGGNSGIYGKLGLARALTLFADSACARCDVVADELVLEARSAASFYSGLVQKRIQQIRGIRHRRGKPGLEASLRRRETSVKRRKDIYDESADGEKDIEEALRIAKRDDKHILLQFGANWCVWCHKLHELFATDKAVAEFLRRQYVMVLVDVDYTEDGVIHNAKVNERYGRPVQEHGLPVLVVLDSDGGQLATQETGGFVLGDRHDPKRVLEFLNRWQPRENVVGSP